MTSAPFAWSPRGWPSERAFATGGPEVWCYADRFSYLPGESVGLHLASTAREFEVEITRDGARPERVWFKRSVTAEAFATPDDAYAVGCGWPVGLTVDIPESWPSGFYVVTVRAEGTEPWEREHFFVVRAPVERRAEMALVLTTSTMLAYNDWGGANHYRGLGDDPRVEGASPRVSLMRPVARGMIRKPPGAPREANPLSLPMHAPPRYPAYEWARLFGYSRHHADAFWATYERPFAIWAEGERYRFDMLTQQDLHDDPHALDGYSCAVVVGHDEYWSWEMRDVVDAFVDGGGNLCRLGGNFYWQVRFEEGGTVQCCYRAPALDPLAVTQPRRATTAWEALSLGRPGASTMGLNGMGGTYARYGCAAPRASGGFTVYRERHWAFEGTDLYYGDVLGGLPTLLAGFEMDGVDYTFRRGLPLPTFEDGAPESLEILAMTPAVRGEEDRFGGSVPLGGPLDEGEEYQQAMAADIPTWASAMAYRGAGMIGVFERGAGTVFNGGSTEWPHALEVGDPFCTGVVRNVLDRFGAERA
ncbi:MAG: hypothetical protein M0T80_01870 [Actinomycetota bacterium]|nr:hypothetical protein [Actinomycetota bacterium]